MKIEDLNRYSLLILIWICIYVAYGKIQYDKHEVKLSKAKLNVTMLKKEHTELEIKYLKKIIGDK